ncbi:predicted protein [Nematostella vectensis]|uniref:F5/8 type C domain-containing protein n=1 Tax=Nematostella vectensis TaxID=45351 RepID=A7RT08_NEMVE|nr:predicted protein [Nematostella vectensis]|eukprot:XP_001637431.1 predicted protein [Nematostella vectensis]
MQSRYIPDRSIRASSQWDRNHGPERARLHIRKGRGKTGAWSARHNNRRQWIQIDLRRRYVITMISTQGRQDYNQWWVTSYTISYSNTGKRFNTYRTRQGVRVFVGNYDKNTVVTRVLRPIIKARFIRINPRTWYRHISMRLELYGRNIGISK